MYRAHAANAFAPHTNVHAFVSFVLMCFVAQRTVYRKYNFNTQQHKHFLCKVIEFFFLFALVPSLFRLCFTFNLFFVNATMAVVSRSRQLILLFISSSICLCTQIVLIFSQFLALVLCATSVFVVQAVLNVPDECSTLALSKVIAFFSSAIFRTYLCDGNGISSVASMEITFLLKAGIPKTRTGTR